MNGQPVLPQDDDPDLVWEELYRPEVAPLPPTPLSRRQRRSRRILRNVAGVTASLVLLAGAAGGLMLASVFALYQAIEQRDGGYLESHVDWSRLQPAMRADLQRMAAPGLGAASSDAYLGRLIDTTMTASRKPQVLAELIATRARSEANYRPVNPGLRDVLDRVDILSGLEVKLDLMADPYTVVSGVTLCLRPYGQGTPGMRLFTLGWPESGRRC